MMELEWEIDVSDESGHPSIERKKRRISLGYLKIAGSLAFASDQALRLGQRLSF